MKKRILSVLIAATMLICMLPTAVFAAGTHTNHCVCGEQESVHSNCKDIEWTAWNGTDPIPYDSNKTAYVYLSANAERSSTLEVSTGYTLYLCLSGNTLSPASGFTDRAITVSSGATFVLTDCGEGGAISGFTSSTSGGGGVRNNGGTFTMYGGTISGNRTTGSRVEGDGGGVYNNNGTVTMYGGTISGNTASRYGGGVSNNRGTFTMYGGTISGNTATYNGGGVYNYGGTFTMENVTVSDNTANTAEDASGANGGGIYCSTGTLIIRGGTISGNEIKGMLSCGGGITVSSGATAEITDVTISGNTAYNGGGIYLGNGATAEITDVTISGNTATYNGGGVVNYGTFTIKNSTVSGNTAYYGGGVYNYGTLNLSGNSKIINNTKDTAGNLTPNNIYLLLDNIVTVAGALTCEDASIGVTMQNYNGGTFTTGGAAYIGKFVSDSSTHGIAVDGDNLALQFQYTVTFNYGTLGSETKTVLRGETVTPPAPVFTGKVLVGWYTNSNFSTEFDFDNPITANKTIYAKFADYEDDKAALQDAIDDAKADLQGEIDAVNSALSNKADASELADTVTDLVKAKAAIQDLLDKIDDYEGADTALKAELKGYIDNADDVLKTSIDELDGRVDDIENALNGIDLTQIAANKTSIATLTGDLGDLNALLNTIKTNYTSADADLQAKIDTLNTKLTKLINETVAELTDSVNTLKNALNIANSLIDTNTDDITTLKTDVSTLKTWKDNAHSAIEALQGLTNTQGTNISNLQTAVANLQTAVNMANSKITVVEDRIAVLEGKVSSLETAKQNLEVAITALNAAINNKADTVVLNQKVSELNAAITVAQVAAKAYADEKDTALKTELTAAIATAKGEAVDAAKDLVDAAKAELQNAIDNKADIVTLNTKVSELNDAIETAETTAKAYTDSAVTTLTAAIATAKGEAVDAAKDLVDAAKAELQNAIDSKADTATVNSAIANLQNAITALQNAKDNYIAADAALKAELEEKIAKAKQEAIDAAKGYIPYIGTNGNWWIGDTDTGVNANGIKGDTGNGIASVTTKKENGVTTVTITFTDTTKEPIVFTVSDGANGDDGADGTAIARIKKTATNGNVDTYTIVLTNGDTYTFTVTNGKDGANGKDGENGKDGLTPFIGENGNWWIGEIDTGVKAAADDIVPVGGDNVTEEEGVDTLTVAAIAIAGIALLGNILLAVLVFKKRKSLS